MTEEEEYVSSSGGESNYAILNHTHQLILQLRESFFQRVKPNPKLKVLPQPIILEAQLMQATSDKFSLRNEIELLIRKRIIRCFYINLSSYGNERYFMLESDYLEQLENEKSENIQRFKDFIDSHNFISPTISTKTLESHSFSREDISFFVNKKILLLNTERGQEYLIHVPSSGKVVRSISEGRRVLVTYLSHQKNKIADKLNIESHNIESSVFYAEFHCQELLGIGVFEEIKIPNRPVQLLLKFNPYTPKN